LRIDQDEAWYLDGRGDLVMVDLDPNDTLKDSGFDFGFEDVDLNKARKVGKKFMA